MMTIGLWVVFGWMVLVTISGVVLLIWGFRNGQFRNIEEAKYRMLEDREPAPWPGRKEKGE